MQQSPSWEAKVSSAGQEIPVHFIQPGDSVRHSQQPTPYPYPKPHQFSSSPPSNFLKIYLILGSPSDLFPQVSPVTLYCNHAVPHTCYIPQPSQTSWFYHLNNIWWEVQVIKFLIMLSSPFLCYPVPLRPKYLPQHPILEHPQPMFLAQCERRSSSPIQTTGHNYGSVDFQFYICG